MQRRTFLQVGTAAVAAVPVVADRQAGDDYGPFGEVELDGVKELVLGDDRTVAYVATTTGFATVDVSDPDPRVLASRRDLLAGEDDGPMRQIYDVTVDGDRLVVVGPANRVDGALAGFVVYDVADPADPRQVAFRRTDHPIHNAFLDGEHLYLTGNGLEGNPVSVWDLADDDPAHLSQWSVLDHDEGWADVEPALYTVHDVFVRDGHAYLAYWDAGTWILDVSDPATPEYVADVGDHALADLVDLESEEAVEEYIGRPGNAHYAAVDDAGDLLAVGKESWALDEHDDAGGPSGIDLWDVRDPIAPEKYATIEATDVEDATPSGTFTTAHNFEIRGDRLYSSWYQDGVRVHDVSDPADPEPLAHWRDPAEKSFWSAVSVRPGEFFVAANAAAINVSAPESVMTFPDEAGTQAGMPPLEPTPTPGPTETATPTEATTPTETTGNGGTTTDESTPGFGPLAAAGGLALGAWYSLRRRDSA